MAGTVTYWRDPDGWCFAVEVQQTPDWTIVTGSDTSSCEQITEEEFNEFKAWREREAEAALEEFEALKNAAMAAVAAEKLQSDEERELVLDALKNIGLDDTVIEILRRKL